MIWQYAYDCGGMTAIPNISKKLGLQFMVFNSRCVSQNELISVTTNLTFQRILVFVGRNYLCLKEQRNYKQMRSSWGHGIIHVAFFPI